MTGAHLQGIPATLQAEPCPPPPLELPQEAPRWQPQKRPACQTPVTAMTPTTPKSEIILPVSMGVWASHVSAAQPRPASSGVALHACSLPGIKQALS